jgi:hypothetical protein
MRYAYVLLELIIPRLPNGLLLLKFRDGANRWACGGEREFENCRFELYCASSPFSIFLYNFLSPPAAFVV